MPAQAGIQFPHATEFAAKHWIPAFAGMTSGGCRNRLWLSSTTHQDYSVVIFSPFWSFLLFAVPNRGHFRQSCLILKFSKADEGCMETLHLGNH